ncbi:hypothetical protein GCM10007079_32950 [Nocardiopsis terrae]|nr:hypothetical protein GCM10007079_32950 [Nocardiopsis terrae]
MAVGGRTVERVGPAVAPTGRRASVVARGRGTVTHECVFPEEDGGGATGPGRARVRQGQARNTGFRRTVATAWWTAR